MSIVRYRPWPAQAAFQQDIRHLLTPLLEASAQVAEDSTAWLPAMDVREEESQFVVLADVPGVDPSTIEVQMDKGVLSVKGERSGTGAVEGERFSRIERRHGSFHRRFAMPDSVDAEGISAHARDGVLEIRIPKRAERAPRRIPVATAGAAAA